MIATQPTCEEAALKEFNSLYAALFDDEPMPDDGHCTGTLATFYTNKQLAPDTCTGCVKHPACNSTHENHMDRITRFLADCFGHKPVHPRGLAEPVKCETCFVRKDCIDATTIIQTIQVQSVVASPTTPRAKATPEAVCPVQDDRGSPALEPEVANFITAQELAQTIERFQSKSNENVTAALQDISQEIRRTGKTEYSHPLRVQFVAASIELNNRGIMPAFRPACRATAPKKGESYPADDTKLANDLRLIDVDYLSKHHPHGHGRIFKNLLNDDGTLDNKKAWEFVTTPGNAEKKAELLILTPIEIAELFIIRDNKTRLRWERLRKHQRSHMGMIRTALNAGRKGGTADEHWQLYALCVILDWSVKAITDAATRMPGLTISERTIRRSIPWLTESAKLPRGDE
ncbi:hypothetical protein [Dechloromonas denitrificans]|uniref:hypothetical protein n=1 Tax=Dechloromonas denitrificans TaxID=281362 RepID=UPI001CF8B09F|nr:hypothetical protein [Dechloromonas denitrificans]UCV04979.1 hypothetical protein KI611_06900 [Dechloromonas denitrificans]